MSENEAERGAKDEEVRNLNVGTTGHFENGPKDSSNTACYFDVQGVLCWPASNQFKKKVESQTSIPPHDRKKYTYCECDSHTKKI